MLLGLRFIERNRVAERLDHIYSPPVLDIAIATLVYGFVAGYLENGNPKLRGTLEAFKSSSSFWILSRSPSVYHSGAFLSSASIHARTSICSSAEDSR